MPLMLSDIAISSFSADCADRSLITGDSNVSKIMRLTTNLTYRSMERFGSSKSIKTAIRTTKMISLSHSLSIDKSSSPPCSNQSIQRIITVIFPAVSIIVIAKKNIMPTAAKAANT
ncbi:hypothetical protein D3C80_1458560 [compost metagenome]